MSFSDYGQIVQEKVWASRESTFNSYKSPIDRDQITLRGPARIPSVLTTRVRSEEIRATPDTDQTIARKKEPAAFELRMYMKAPALPGYLPMCANLMRDTFGIETMLFTVLTFGGLTGKSLTVKIGDAAPTVVTEGAGWTAATSNAATATSLASALDALAGISAIAVGAVVQVQRDLGTPDVSITHNALRTDLDHTGTEYTLKTAILEEGLTVTHLKDNVLSRFRGCKTGAVIAEISGTDEGNLRFTGLLGNEVFAGYHTLGANISGTGSPGDVITATMTEKLAFLLGPLVTDTVFVQIDSEQFEVMGVVDYTAKTVSLKRGANTTALAAHTTGAQVSPVFPGLDPDNNDSILPLVLGVFNVDGDNYRVATATITKNENINARLDEWGEAASTGYRRPVTGRDVTMQFVAYQRSSIVQLETLSERGTTVATLVTAGGQNRAPTIEISLPRCQFTRPEDSERGGEFAVTFNAEGLASSTPGNDGIKITFRPAA